MARDNHISGHDWWNWRGKTEAVLQALDRELDEHRRRNEALAREQAERLGELSAIVHAVRESVAALIERMEHLHQALARLEGRPPGAASFAWPGGAKAAVVSGGVAAGGSALAWVAYGAVQLGRLVGWW